MTYIEKLKQIGTCKEAIVWRRNYSTFKEAWKKCERVDWMLWIAVRLCKNEERRKELVLITCKCARRSLKYISKNEKRPLKAIQTAEKWAKNLPGIKSQDVIKAADIAIKATHSAYYLNYANTAADAASAAAANAAVSATATDINNNNYAPNAATFVVEAAYIDYIDVDYVKCAAIRIKELKIMSNIVRKHLSVPEI